MKFAILTSVNNPFLGNYVKSLFENDLSPEAIIYDRKSLSKRDLQIIKDRIKGKILNIELGELPNNYKSYYVDDHNSDKCVEIIIKTGVELLINAGTPRIINENLLNSVSFGVLNVHPGILPYYRGCSAVEWSLYNQHAVGITAHLMSKEIDAGDIIYRKIIDTTNVKSYEEIRVSVYIESFNLMSYTAKEIITGRVTRSNLIPQGNEGKYWGPISNSKMSSVRNIVDNGKLIRCNEKFITDITSYYD